MAQSVIKSSKDLGERLIALVDDDEEKLKHFCSDALLPAEQYFEKLDDLIKAGADINYRHHRTGDTALIAAAENGDSNIVSYLLQHGADVNEKNFNGDTALMKCSEIDEDFLILLDAGADPNIQNHEGDTALMAAITSKYKLVKSFQKLKRIVLKIDNEEYRKMRIEENDFIRALIEKGVDVNIQNDRGQTALMLLLSKSRVLKTPFGRNIHQIAADPANANDLKMRYDVGAHLSNDAQCLLEAGADVHLKDWYGNNALMYAGRARMFDVAKMILENNYFEDKIYQDFLELVE